MSGADADRVLACDLDGTYVAVNTFPRFTTFALVALARRGRLDASLTIAWALARRRVAGLSHVELKATVHHAARHLPAVAIRRWCRSLLAQHTNPAVRDLVAAWPGRTVLATAAPSIYADALAEFAGFDACQSSGPAPEGYIDNMTGVKASRLASLVGVRVACAVSDDPVVDLPLLLMADEPILVDATGEPRPWTESSGPGLAVGG